MSDSIHEAAKRGDADKVQYFLSQGNPVTIRYEHGNTLLHLGKYRILYNQN